MNFATSTQRFGTALLLTAHKRGGNAVISLRSFPIATKSHQHQKDFSTQQFSVMNRRWMSINSEKAKNVVLSKAKKSGGSSSSSSSSSYSTSSSSSNSTTSTRLYGKSGQVFLHKPTQVDKFILVSALKFWPTQIPAEIGMGVMNTAYSRFRIITSVMVFGVLLYYVEMAIRSARVARDGGEETIYTDAAGMELQKEKRLLNPELVQHGGIIERASKDLHAVTIGTK